MDLFPVRCVSGTTQVDVWMVSGTGFVILGGCFLHSGCVRRCFVALLYPQQRLLFFLWLAKKKQTMVYGVCPLPSNHWNLCLRVRKKDKKNREYYGDCLSVGCRVGLVTWFLSELGLNFKSRPAFLQNLSLLNVDLTLRIPLNVPIFTRGVVLSDLQLQGFGWVLSWPYRVLGAKA